MPEYAIVLSVILFVAMYLHRKYRVQIYKSRDHMIKTNLLLLVLGFFWDQMAISRGHWSFGQQFLLGPKIGLIPIEEFGFIFILSYFALVVYKITSK